MLIADLARVSIEETMPEHLDTDTDDNTDTDTDDVIDPDLPF